MKRLVTWFLLLLSPFGLCQFYFNEHHQRHKDSLPADTLHQAHHFIDKASFAHHIHNYHNRHKLQQEDCSFAKAELWQQEMDDFVHHPSTRTLFYIFYHDAKSREIALNLTRCRDWMYPLQLQLSRYMENQVYRDVFFYLQKYWIDHNVSYIMTTSYKMLESTELSLDHPRNVSLRDYFNYLKMAHDVGYDLVPVVRTALELLPHAVACHKPGFRIAWDAVLKAMGFEEEQIRQIDRRHAFFKNAQIVRLPTFLMLTNFMTFATNLMETNSTVDKAGSGFAFYDGGMTAEQKQIAFHADYYQLYPFILERLPVFFAYHFDLKICDYTHNECPYSL